MYTKEFRPQLAAKSVHLDVLSHEIDKEKKNLWSFMGTHKMGWVHHHTQSSALLFSVQTFSFG